MDLSGVWRPSSPTTTCAAPGSTPPTPTTRLGADRRARPLALARPPSPTPTGRCSTGTASSTPRPEPGARRVAAASTGSSTRATSGSTAPTSATPRATSSPTRFEVTEALADRTEHVLGVEVTCTPPARPQRQAQHHRRVPALGLPRPRLEPGRHLAAGARSSAPGRSASGTCGCCAARPPSRAGRSSPCRAVLDAAERRARRVRTTRRRASTTSRSAPSPPARTRSSGRSPSPDPRLWWPHALGDQPLARRRRRGHRRGATAPSEPPPHAAAPACARCRCATGSLSVNGERLFLKGANQGPTRMALAEATPEELAARRRPRQSTPASTSLRVHAHITPARALRRRRRGRPARSGRTSRCSGATPAASASRRCARPARRSTCSATTRRSRSGAATTSRSPRHRRRADGGQRRDVVAGRPRSPRSCRPGTRRCSTAR